MRGHEHFCDALLCKRLPDIWTAAVGEILLCVREPTNASDRYAVAVTRPGGLGVVIGHLPRKLSKICSLFIRRGGSICCIVTGGRRYSADLPEGGLEIKVTYFIYGPRFFPFAASIVLSTSLFTAAISWLIASHLGLVVHPVA